jgi:hypothetical protein
LTVRRQFASKSSSSLLAAGPGPTSLAGAEVHDKEKERADDDTASTLSTGTTTSTSTYSARIAQTYRSMVESRAAKSPQPREFFYCILKGSVLFLYEDEEQSECVAAITVDKYTVGMESKEGGPFKGKDAEMFAKRNAIVLRMAERRPGEKKGLAVLSKGMAGDGAGAGVDQDEGDSETAPWFMFSKSNIKWVV